MRKLLTRRFALKPLAVLAGCVTVAAGAWAKFRTARPAVETTLTAFPFQLGPRTERAPGEKDAPVTAREKVNIAAAARDARDGADATPNARLAALGQRIFFDVSLSEPPGTSCATCHEPARGFAGNNGSTSGVARGSRAGHFARRTTPSLLYLAFVRPFHFHWEEDAPLPDAFGGFFWDGRSDSLATLVREPLFNPDEMNAGEPARVADKLRKSDYARELRAAWGTALDDAELAMTSLGAAIEAFLLRPEMSPFSSKYDNYVRGAMPLTNVEARGLALFKDPAKGNCVTCHRLNDASGKPERSLFTDYGFEVVAVPRNRALSDRAPARTPDDRFDLGLCERKSPEHVSEERFCGAFRAPSLRNVALRPTFMHSGTFHDLRDVVAFYATRGTNPERWYPGASFDDLPERFRANVNVEKAPYDKGRSERPRLDDGEIDALVAFLHTLTDAPAK